jgi:D-arabinose 1-dehydrogenase-like Zn-dependent alcohol dehydrogenase
LIAITVAPGRPHQVQLEERADPSPADGELLAETLALGVCGTDREIVAGEYGWAPPGSERLVLGHEWLGRVRKCARWRRASARRPGRRHGATPRSRAVPVLRAR